MEIAMAYEHEDEVFLTETVEVTNRQIYKAIKMLESSVKGQASILEDICTQTTKTNGRVTVLEKKTKQLEDVTIWFICKKYHKILLIVFFIGVLIAGTNAFDIIQGWF